jgi:hypothetical protein
MTIFIVSPKNETNRMRRMAVACWEGAIFIVERDVELGGRLKSY